MKMNGNTIHPITHIALTQPEMSRRRNRSEATVMSNQNHTIKKEDREDVEQEISIGEALLKEEHRDPPLPSTKLTYYCS